MKTQTDNTREQQSDTAPKVQQEPGTGGTATITDNRPSTIYQRKLRETMANSPRVQTQAPLRETMNNSPRNQATAQLRETMDAHAASKVLPVQRKVSKGSSRFQQIATAMGERHGVDTSGLVATHNSSFPGKLNAEATIQGNKIHFAPGMDTDYNIRHEVAHAIDNTLNGTPKGDRVVNGQNIDTTREKAADRMAKNIRNYSKPAQLQSQAIPQSTGIHQRSAQIPLKHSEVVQRVKKSNYYKGGAEIESGNLGFYSEFDLNVPTPSMREMWLHRIDEAIKGIPLEYIMRNGNRTLLRGPEWGVTIETNNWNPIQRGNDVNHLSSMAYIEVILGGPQGSVLSHLPGIWAAAYAAMEQLGSGGIVNPGNMSQKLSDSWNRIKPPNEQPTNRGQWDAAVRNWRFGFRRNLSQYSPWMIQVTLGHALKDMQTVTTALSEYGLATAPQMRQGIINEAEVIDRQAIETRLRAKPGHLGHHNALASINTWIAANTDTLDGLARVGSALIRSLENMSREGPKHRMFIVHKNPITAILDSVTSDQSDIMKQYIMDAFLGLVVIRGKDAKGNGNMPAWHWNGPNNTVIDLRVDEWAHMVREEGRDLIAEYDRQYRHGQVGGIRNLNPPEPDRRPRAQRRPANAPDVGGVIIEYRQFYTPMFNQLKDRVGDIFIDLISALDS